MTSAYYDYKNIADGGLVAAVPTTAGAVVTCAGNQFEITNILLVNTGDVARIVSLHLVQNNAGAVGTAAATNMFYRQWLRANETVHIPIPPPGLILPAENDTIQAIVTPDEAAPVNIIVTGRVVTPVA